MSNGSSIDIKVGASTKGVQTGLQHAKHKIREFSASVKAELAQASQAEKELAAAMKQVVVAQGEQLKMDKLRAQAAGDGEAAAAIEREIKVREEALRLTEELNIAEHEAYAIAQERADLEEKIAGGRKPEGGGSLESDNKVENQLVGLAENLTSTDSAGDAASATFTALAESLQLTLGASIAAGAGIAIGSKLNEAREAAEKFNDELDELFKPQQSFQFESISNLETRLEALQEKLKELGKEQSILSMLSEGLDEMGGFVEETGVKQRDRQLSEIFGAIEEAKKDRADKVGQENEALQLELAGNEKSAELLRLKAEYEELRGTQLVKNNSLLGDQLKIQEKLKADAIDAQAREKSDAENSEVNEKLKQKWESLDQADKEAAYAALEAAAELTGYTSKREEITKRQALLTQKIADIESDMADEEDQTAAIKLGADKIEAERQLARLVHERAEMEKEISAIERQIGYDSLRNAAEIVGKTSKRAELAQQQALVERQIVDLAKEAAKEADPVREAALRQEGLALTHRSTALTKERQKLEEDISKAARETAYIQLQGEIDRMPASQLIERSKAQVALYEMQIADLAEDALTADELRKGEIDKQTAALLNQIEAQKQLRRQQFIDDKKAGPHGTADRKQREREEAKFEGQARRAEAREAKEQAQRKAREAKPVELPWKSRDPREKEVLGPHMPEDMKNGIKEADPVATEMKGLKTEITTLKNTLTPIKTALTALQGKIGVA